MRDLILSHEPAIRLSFFLGILTAMALWEALAPRRPAPLEPLGTLAEQLPLRGSAVPCKVADYTINRRQSAQPEAGRE
jgi:hypothetical protein